MSLIRIVLAEDHNLVREGTRQILDRQKDFSVVGEAGDGLAVASLVESLKPDVAILDVRLPGKTGIEVASDITRRFPLTRVLLLTAFDDDDFVLAGLEAGAHGYLLKTARAAELVKAIRAVHNGETVLDTTISARMTQILMRRRQVDGEGSRREMLTPREWEVLKLAAHGLKNREIAEFLQVSSRTVEGHFSSVLGKLGVTTRTAAVMHAVSHKWITQDGLSSS